MVKIAENKVVDIDVMPGTKEDQLKAQADALTYAPVNSFSRTLYTSLL